MDRSPLFLAGLASAAVPGLDPASVEALPGAPGHQYDVAFVQDTQHRRWVVRVPRSQAAAAQMESTFALLALLARRLPFGVPTPKGFAALKEGGRAAIYPYLPGHTLDFTRLPAGPGLAAELGRAVAALHNADHSLFDEAGLPAYDADTYRTRRLTELDTAASTGHVPTALLGRWERSLEDVALWRFAPTPTHGDLTGDQVLVVFDDEDDAASGRVRALTGWEDAKVADPADDFAALATQAPAGALETLMEAYSHARSERPDPALLTRARLSAEMRTVPELMAAVGSGDQLQVERLSAHLRRLDQRLQDEEQEDDDYRRPAFAAPRSPATVLVPPQLHDEPQDDEDLSGVTPAGDTGAAGGDRPSEVTDGAEVADQAEVADEAQVAEQADQADQAEVTNEAMVVDQAEVADEAGPVEGHPEAADGGPGHGEARGARPAEDDAHTRDEVTAEIDLSHPVTHPAPVTGDDPGPEFEPGWRPTS